MQSIYIPNTYPDLTGKKFKLTTLNITVLECVKRSPGITVERLLKEFNLNFKLESIRYNLIKLEKLGIVYRHKCLVDATNYARPADAWFINPTYRKDVYVLGPKQSILCG